MVNLGHPKLLFYNLRIRSTAPTANVLLDTAVAGRVALGNGHGLTEMFENKLTDEDN